MKTNLIRLTAVILLFCGMSVPAFGENRPSEGKQFEQWKQPPPPPSSDSRGKRRPPRPGRPGFMAELLENSDLSQEEKARVRALMEKDPREAKKAMHQLFEARRKAWEQETQRLRQNCLNAKTEDEKKAASEALKQHLRKETERRLASNKRMLESMKKQIARMQNDLLRMQKQYEERVADKDVFLEHQFNEILEKGLPEHRPGRR